MVRRRIIFLFSGVLVFSMVLAGCSEEISDLKNTTEDIKTTIETGKQLVEEGKEMVKTGKELMNKADELKEMKDDVVSKMEKGKELIHQ